ncbi:MAG: nucleotidyltransferase family protein [Novosphingobium sp.]
MNRPCALSPELALLAACDLASDRRLSAMLDDAAARNIDWRRFGDLAEGNGMAGLAMARLSQAAPASVPAPLQERFAGVERAGALAHMLQGRTSVRLSRDLAKAGIRSIVLKGQALSHMLYRPYPHWRTSSDIDLLIPSGALAGADRLLRDEGFVRQWPEQDLPEHGGDMILLLANVFEYVCQESGQLVELHHRITLNPHWLPGDFEALDRTASEVETGQGAVRGLDGPMLVAYLCWHAFAHYNFRLKWVSDIVRALRHTGFASCAQACPPEAGFAQGPVELADALLAAVLPAIDDREASVTKGVWRRQIGRIVAGMEDPRRFPTRRSLASLPAEAAFRAFLARLSPGLRGKGYELIRGLCDPRDVATLGLGARYAPLYAVAGPLLALKRFAVRQATAA